GAERVELLAGELVALGMERDAERVQLGAVGVEAPREGLVRHLGVALDVLLDVPGGQRPPLCHEERDERELANELVGVVRHAAPRAYRAEPVDCSRRSAAGGSGCDLAALEVLVRRAVVALGQRRALARLALARGRAAAGDA